LVLTGDEYVRNVLSKYAVSAGQGSLAYNAANQVYPIIQKWAGTQLLEASFSGSYAKGTSVRGVTDVDLFISLKSDTSNTLKEIFDSLYSAVVSAGYSSAKKQHVSIHCKHGGIDVDLVPGVKQSGNTDDHWLYVNRAGKERIQTNIVKHINIVKGSSRFEEIKAIKIWRLLHSIDICSFYLELAVIEALKGYKIGNVASNVLRALKYLGSDFVDACFVDPANTNNVISDELSLEEKRAVAAKAKQSRAQQHWENIIW